MEVTWLRRRGAGRGTALDQWLTGDATGEPKAPSRPRTAAEHGLGPRGSRYVRGVLMGSLAVAAVWFSVAADATASSAGAADAAPVVEPVRGELVIHGVGDVNLDPAELPAIAAGDHDDPWRAVAGLFRADDLTVGNLECAASALGEPEPKDYTFRCDPGALPAMRAAGVDVVNLANNHSGDFGPEALLDGRHAVESAGVRTVGVGRNVDEAEEAVVVEAGGWRVAVLGFGGVVPTTGWLAGPDRPGMASGDDTDRMVAAVEAAGEIADLVVVTVHWGRELAAEPDADDVARAERLVAAGADVVFGHHAHVLQPLRRYGDRPVFYGLGNFVWPRRSDRTAQTGIARVVVDPDGWITACLVPAEIHHPGRPVPTGGPVPAGCPSDQEMPRSASFQ